MWDYNNRTPFAADIAWTRDKNGAEVWIVAVKATFLIRSDGSTTIADEQPPVKIAPEFRDNPVTSSLLYDSDVYHTKPMTDVLLHGHAYAPAMRATTQVDVTMQVGPINKTLRVTGDRIWRGGKLLRDISPPKPFEMMPVLYERAYGGRDDSDPKNPVWEARNPVGVGFRSAEGTPVPNIEAPKNLVGPSSRHTEPAGFGPIASHWLPRVAYSGTYDERWLNSRHPLQPDDFESRFYLCAPTDQQVPGYLKGGEPVQLVNVTPGGILRFNLPRVVLAFATRFTTGEVTKHQAKLHTVIFEPDLARVSMVYHTHLSCHLKVLKLQETAINRKRVVVSTDRHQLVLIAE